MGQFSVGGNTRVLYNQVSVFGAKNLYTIYVRGVGTEPNSQNVNLIQSGFGGYPLRQQVNEALRLAKETVVKIKANDSEASFVFITAGFSRGAAAARVVNNKLTKYFSQDPIFGNSAPVIGATILFDTVVTITPSTVYEDRYENNQPVLAFDLRQDLSIPNSVVQGIHIVAENEYRNTFPSTPVEGARRVSYDTSKPVISSGSLKRFLELPVPGAHSDIGGTYSPDGISAFTLQIAVRYLEKLGVRLAPLHPIYLPNPSNYAIHDSQYCPIEPFSKVIERAREEKKY